MRRCVVCRTPAPTLSLVQLAYAGPTERKAYVCIKFDCLSAAHQAVRLRGEKKTPSKTPPNASSNAFGLRQEVHALAEARLWTLLGLARRAGLIRLGVDKVAELGQQAQLFDTQSGSDADPVAFRATDLASRSAHQLAWAVPFGSSVDLGRAIGVGAAGAVAILAGSLSKQAVYWLRVWYESDADGAAQGAAGPDIGEAAGSRDAETD